MAIKKDKVYTEQQQLFLDALQPCGGKIRAAMTVAGYAPGTPERYIINLLYEEIVDIANKLLAASAIEAALGLTGVLGEPEKLGNANVINAAKEILDRGGVTKKSEDSVKVDTSGGILILPAKRTRVIVEDAEEA